jgi:adenylate cyclase
LKLATSIFSSSRRYRRGWGGRGPSEGGQSSVRIRHADPQHHTLTAKRGGGLVRDEQEIEITKDAFNILWPLTKGLRVYKVRHFIAFDSGSQIEVDEFLGDLTGLVVAEVEFPSVAAAQEFVPLSCFTTEVTKDSRYTNAVLARNGRPQPA